MRRSTDPMESPNHETKPKKDGITERGPMDVPIPRAHRLDESPAGYSLASCSPAELASASPVEHYNKRRLLAAERNRQRTGVSSFVRVSPMGTSSGHVGIPADICKWPPAWPKDVGTNADMAGQRPAPPWRYWAER